MLAKPEYFSPPNEVCGWPGRRAIGKMWLAEGAAVAEILLAGALMRRCSWQWAPWRRGIGKQMLAGVPRRAIAKQMLAEVPRRAIGKQRQRKKPAQGA